MSYLAGKKTYIVAVLTVVYAIIGIALGKVDVNTAIQLLLASGAVASLRSAIEGVQTTLSK